MKQMKYILANDERKELKNNNKQDKEQHFYQIWKKRFYEGLKCMAFIKPRL